MSIFVFLNFLLMHAYLVGTQTDKQTEIGYEISIMS